MKQKTNKAYKPVEVGDYIPGLVARLFEKVNQTSFSRLCIAGFGVNMRWLHRIARENNIVATLADWRPRFTGYDCGGQEIISLKDFPDEENNIIIVCPDDVSEMKECMSFIFDNRISRSKVLYDFDEPYMPFNQDEPYCSILNRARDRAVSMITKGQLFELIQFIEATKDVEGDVVEYGSLYGGSGAVIVEAVRHFGEKSIYLFDSFDGIPKSKYGLDHHWNGSFSDNSFSSVRDAFSDCSNVEVIKGNILETHKRLEGSLSFAYIASDTLESGEILLEYIWPRLSVGGIVSVCDYGSYPNAIPLTMYVDRFFSKQRDAQVFRPYQVGLFAIKN